MNFRQVLREPLVHFLGLSLFLLHALVAPTDSGGDTIVITQVLVASRQPTPISPHIWLHIPTNFAIRRS
jgi:hypothetical protein